jgi:hypothetical protein
MVNKKSGYEKFVTAHIQLILFIFYVLWLYAIYIMPPIPPPAGIGGTSSLMLATTDSVVRSVEATEHAF